MDRFYSFSKMTMERIDPFNPNNNSECTKLNQAVINSLIDRDWHDNLNNRPRATESGTRIAGNFSVFIAALKIESGDEAVGACALRWGKSTDGKEILVTIRASSLEIDEIVALGRAIPIN